MLKVITINKEHLNDRFEPRYHFFGKLHDVAYEKFGFQLISEFTLLKSGTTPDHTDERITPSDVIFIKSADVKRFNINHTTLSFISKETNTKRKGSIVYPNDILITNTGKYPGFTSYVTKSLQISNINQNIIRIRFKDDSETIFTQHFLTGFLNSKFGQTAVESFLTLTGQKYLNMTKFREMRIPKIDKVFINELSKKLRDVYDLEDNAITLISKARDCFYSALAIDFKTFNQPLSFPANLSDFKEIDLWTPQYVNPLYIDILDSLKEKFEVLPLGTLVKMKKGDEVGSTNYISFINSKQLDVPFIRTSDIVNYECDNFSDFFITNDIFNELNQDVEKDDIVFTKDGKIGMCGMLTENDRIILSSGILRMRLKSGIPKLYGITPEYLFIVLSTKETGFYPAKRRTVVASTIPHLREDRINDMEIPLINKGDIESITKFVTEAFLMKQKKKFLIKNIVKDIDEYFEKSLLV